MLPKLARSMALLIQIFQSRLNLSMTLKKNIKLKAWLHLSFLLVFWPGFLFAEEHEIKLGVLTELSGQFASNGVDCRIGHDTALKAYTDQGKIGDYRVRLIY